MNKRTQRHLGTFLMLVMLVSVMTCMAMADNGGTITGSGDTYTVTYDRSGCVNNGEYILLVLSRGTPTNAITDDSILYIDQKNAGESGVLSFTVKPKAPLAGDVYLAGTFTDGVSSPRYLGSVEGAGFAIVSGPVNKTAATDTTAQFTVVATSATAYQWQYWTGTDWVNTPEVSSTSATLSVVAVPELNNRSYRCLVYKGEEMLSTEPAMLSVVAVTQQPVPVATMVGTTAQFAVVATSATAYQWQYWTGTDWVNTPEPSSTSATLSVEARFDINGRSYRCLVINGEVVVSTAPAMLTVTEVPVAPTIVQQPQTVSVAAGSEAQFTIIATGATAYQWQYWTGAEWVNTPEASSTSDTLRVVATAELNNRFYRCLVYNGQAMTSSSPAMLSVTASFAPPMIVTPPESTSAAIGATAQFTVVATNAETYQWQYWTGAEWVNTPEVSGTTATLSVVAAAELNNRYYRCVVRNGGFEASTAPVGLTVTGGFVPPTIVTHPESTSAAAGATAQFTVVATNAETYQWQYWTGAEWVNTPEASGTTATLSVVAAAELNNRYYRCVVRNGGLEASTAPAGLTVTGGFAPPTIVTHPESTSVAAGNTAYFTVVATNAGTYQWQYWNGADWVNTPEASSTSATLSVVAAAEFNNRYYRCVVRNGGLEASTAPAGLTVLGVALPSIVAHPQDTTVKAGNMAYFTVTATNAGTYQWQYWNGAVWLDTPETSSTSATLSVTATAELNGRYYRCVVRNGGYEVSTAPAGLTVIAAAAPPSIVAHPQDTTAVVGNTAYFTVTATNAGTYQWQYWNGAVWLDTPEASSTSATLSVTATAELNGRYYRCVVRNGGYEASTAPAGLTVIVSAAPPSIVMHPESTSAVAGSTAYFTVTATNAGTYQWQYWNGADWVNTPEASSTSATLSVVATAELNNRYYRCVVRNGEFVASTEPAGLTVMGGVTSRAD